MLPSINIHGDVISNCKYCEFIQKVLVLILLYLVVRTQYYYFSFIILYYCMYVIISI